jgi:hypothetical protein
MHRYLIELLSAFNARNAKYLVVGGYAVSFHAQPRATKDIDVLIKADAENAPLVYAALADFGAPLKGFTVAEFAETGSFFRLGREPLAIDVLTQIPGVDFDAAWERRVEGIVDTKTGVTAHFISRQDLVAAKIASGRPQDLADVEAIRKAANPRKPSQ